MKNLFEEEIQNNDLVIYLKSVSCGGGSTKDATIAKITDDKLMTWSVSRDWAGRNPKIVFKKKSIKDIPDNSIIKKVKITEAKKFIKNHLVKVDYVLHKDELIKLSKDVFKGLNLK